MGAICWLVWCAASKIAERGYTTTGTSAAPPGSHCTKPAPQNGCAYVGRCTYVGRTIRPPQSHHNFLDTPEPARYTNPTKQRHTYNHKPTQ